MKFLSETEKREICGRFFYKRRDESLQKLAAEYGCHNSTIHRTYLRIKDNPALMAAAKIEADKYYRRTEPHHDDHVGSTAVLVPKQVSAAPACLARAEKQNMASNATAAQPSLLHGLGATASAPDASKVIKSSSVSADLVLRVQQRRPRGDDSRRIIALLERNCILSIEDVAEFRESDFDVAEWGSRADIDAVLLNDSAWETAYWSEKFIHEILGDSTHAHLVLQAEVLRAFKQAGIECESDLRNKHASLQLAMLPRARIRQWVEKLQGPSDTRDDAAPTSPPSTAGHANGSGLVEPAADARCEMVSDSGQDAAARNEVYATSTHSAVTSAASAYNGADAAAPATDQIVVEKNPCIFDYNISSDGREGRLVDRIEQRRQDLDNKKNSVNPRPLPLLSALQTDNAVNSDVDSLDSGMAEELLTMDADYIIGNQQKAGSLARSGGGDMDVDQVVVECCDGSRSVGAGGVVLAISEGGQQGGGDESQHDGAGSVGDVGENWPASPPMHPSLLETFMSNLFLKRKVESQTSHMKQSNMMVLDETIKHLQMTGVAAVKRNRDGEGKQFPVKREYAYIGRGGFGTAIRVMSTQNGQKKTSVYKLEFARADATQQDLALCREYQLYSSVSSSSADEQTPLPRLGNTLAGHPFVTISLSADTTVRILDLEYLSDWPQQVLARSAALFACERRIDSDGRGVFLKILEAILYLESREIQHNDLKPDHIFGRGTHIVFIDYGLAQTKLLTYREADSVCAQAGRGPGMSPGAHSFVPPRFDKGTPIRILGSQNGRLGTPLYRAPRNYPGTSSVEVNVNMAQYGMIILSVICPRLFNGADPTASERFAESKSVLPPERFQEAVLTSMEEVRGRMTPTRRSASARAENLLRAATVADTRPQLHSPFGEDIVGLCQQLLNGKIALPAQAYASNFVRRYIPTCIEWFNKLCARGLVVESYGRVKKPLVIVWDKERGFEVLNLFSFDRDECVTHYMGRKLMHFKSAQPTSQSFSFHSIWLGDIVLDGTPDSTLTVDVMAKFAAAGALIGSSRTNPQERNKKEANLRNPQDPKAKLIQVSLDNGELLHMIEMCGSRPTPFGSVITWCYDWASQANGRAAVVTREQMQEAKKIRQSMPSHWWDIIRERRRECQARGSRDTIFKKSCSIRTCCCRQESEPEEAAVFQFDQVEDTEQCLAACGSLGDPKSRDEYWEMPVAMQATARESVTVHTTFIDSDTGDIDREKRVAARREVQNKLDTNGLVILENFFGSWNTGKLCYDKAKAEAEKMQFSNVVSLNVPTDTGMADPSDGSKTMTGEIRNAKHPVRQALGLVAEHFLPGMVVSEGKDVKTGAAVVECAVLKQAEVEHHSALRANGVDSTVHQIQHTDKEMFSLPGKPRDPENLSRSNLAFFLRNQGPLSIWAPLVDHGQSLSLVGYLGSHKPALALWVFMARHFAKMKEAYQRGRTETEVEKVEKSRRTTKVDEDDKFLRVWIGAARLFLRREYADESEQIRATRVVARRFDVLLVHGLFVHGGTDEVGLRMFAGYSPEGFHHISNVIHTVPDSPVLAAMFDTVLQPLLVKDVPRSADKAETRHGRGRRQS